MRFSKFLFLLSVLPSLVLGETAAAPQVMPTILPAGTTPVAAPATGPQPKIACALPNFDFGNVDEGGDIVHLFHIVNKGKATLKISNVSTSCGCTAAVEDKKEILPGGRGIIKATYHTKGRPGHATKIITVASNDPVNPNFQMKLDMTVIREIDVQPDKIYMYNVPHGQAQTATVKVFGKPHTLFKVLSAESQNKTVTVTALEPIQDKATFRKGASLTVNVPADHTIGNFTDTVKLTTNSKKHPEVDIDVLGEVVGKFTYSPHTIYFSPHQNNVLTVNFTAQDSKNFAVRSARSLKYLARPEVKRVSYGNGFQQYQVLVSPPKSVPQGSDGKDTIVVTTNDPEQPQVNVEVEIH